MKKQEQIASGRKGGQAGSRKDKVKAAKASWSDEARRRRAATILAPLKS